MLCEPFPCSLIFCLHVRSVTEGGRKPEIGSVDATLLAILFVFTLYILELCYEKRKCFEW